MVIMEALQEVGANIDAIRLSSELATQRDPSFVRGYDDALTTTLILTASLDAEQHQAPDIKAAKQAAPQVHASLNLPIGMEMDDHLAQGVAYIHAKVGAHKRAHYAH